MVGMGAAVQERGMVVGTARQYGWLNAIIKAVLVLNLVDAIFTLVWVWAGLATEANALMAGLVERHPVVFVAAKLGLTSLGSILLWRLRRHPIAVVGIFGVFLVYYWVLIYHLSYLIAVT
jgi:hypothetical protein